MLLLSPSETREGKGLTQIFNSVQNFQFHYRRLESLVYLIVCAFSLNNTGILSTTVSSLDHYGLKLDHIVFTRSHNFFNVYPFIILQVHFACMLCV